MVVHFLLLRWQRWQWWLDLRPHLGPGVAPFLLCVCVCVVVVLRRQVSPRFIHTGGVAALHKLRAVGFLKHRHREEAEAIAVDLDLPFDCEEVC